MLLSAGVCLFGEFNLLAQEILCVIRMRGWQYGETKQQDRETARKHLTLSYPRFYQELEALLED